MDWAWSTMKLSTGDGVWVGVQSALCCFAMGAHGVSVSRSILIIDCKSFFPIRLFLTEYARYETQWSGISICLTTTRGYGRHLGHHATFPWGGELVCGRGWWFSVALKLRAGWSFLPYSIETPPPSLPRHINKNNYFSRPIIKHKIPPWSGRKVWQ